MENIPYPVVPFTGAMTSVFDIEDYKEIIKIDHHIVVDSYGNLNLEDSTASSCSQIVALFLKNKRVKLSSFGAAALYMGIIGDTNRFMYSATDERTFEAAMYLYNYLSFFSCYFIILIFSLQRHIIKVILITKIITNSLNLPNVFNVF